MNAFQKMPGDPEVDNLDTELTRLEVGVRQMVQDFPLCATFREIDQQNALVRGEIDSMREKLVRLDNLALEQVPEKKNSIAINASSDGQGKRGRCKKAR